MPAAQAAMALNSLGILHGRLNCHDNNQFPRLLGPPRLVSTAPMTLGILDSAHGHSAIRHREI